MNIIITIRAYEELNDYLPANCRKTNFSCRFQLGSTVEDLLSELNIPSTEIDLILINGSPAKLEQTLKNNDRVALYPVFETLDISGVSRLGKSPLRRPKFIADQHLSQLSQNLRLLGFDVLEASEELNSGKIKQLNRGKRILLTVSPNQLSADLLDRMILIQETDPEKQTEEVIERLNLKGFNRGG